MTLQPLSAQAALDQFYLDARARVLDLAAILDRFDRAPDAASLAGDPRHGRLVAALALLQRAGPNRAAAVQEHFSLAYDPTWLRPGPRE